MFKKISNPRTNGSVATGEFHRDRQEEILDHLLPGRDLSGADTTDGFGLGNRVSLERERGREEGKAASEAGRQQLVNQGLSTEGMGLRDHTVCDVNGFSRGERRK